MRSNKKQLSSLTPMNLTHPKCPKNEPKVIMTCKLGWFRVHMKVYFPELS